MTAPRATVNIGGVVLVAEIGSYKPFGAAALGVTVFDGVEATTIQDFRFRAHRQEGSLASGGGTSPGLLSTAKLAELEALVTTWGAAQLLTDSLGNEGTIKALTYERGWEYHVPGVQGALHSFALTWRWLTLTMRYGAAYSGP